MSVESGIDSSVEETCDDERKIRETEFLLVKLNCLIQDKVVMRTLSSYLSRSLKRMVSMCESIKDGGIEIKLENYLSDPHLPSQQHLIKQYTFKCSSRVKNVKRKTLEYPSLPVKKETTDNISCSHSVVLNSKSKYRKLTGSFTPEIGYVPDCSQVVSCIQDIQLRFYELISLDTYISDEEGKDCFAARCYHTQILESGGNLGNFFSPNKLNTAEFLFIPINVSYHWALLVANLSLEKLNFHDLLGFGTEDKYINLIDLWRKKLNILFCEEHDWPVSYPVHVKQTDSRNCGVFLSCVSQIEY
ncbi:hypothetical protein TNCV_2707241 [Trichonephila clavipes]|nr:hypothetical protein TNCV_2707241 [Trichonephila clavipes]